MFAGLWVSESFGQSEINDVNEMLLLTDTDQEIIGLDISMQEMSRVNKFKSL
jgi:hypothetical protein